ncbi:MAG: hypothetical protein HYY04_12415 [Chloroflexi bacterium]|nr:hypothetical protein [Chloroflexota bacterium]
MHEIEPSQPHRMIFQAALRGLNNALVPYVVGGAHAVGHYTGLIRPVDDLDVLVELADADRAQAALEQVRFAVRQVEPPWLIQLSRGAATVDLMAGTPNWLIAVDEQWIERGEPARLFNTPVRYVAVEELIWTKAYVAGRGRYDGADLVHLLHATLDQIDWDHLLARFVGHEPLLLAHLTLFSYVYPIQRRRLPGLVVRQLVERVQAGLSGPGPADGRICQGTLLDRLSFNFDVTRAGFVDARAQLARQRGIAAQEMARHQRWAPKAQGA